MQILESTVADELSGLSTEAERGMITSAFHMLSGLLK
jgi:hypothetical protein